MNLQAIRRAADSIVALCDDALEQPSDNAHEPLIREAADAILLAIRDGAPLPREDDKLIPDDLRAHVPAEFWAGMKGQIEKAATATGADAVSVARRLMPAAMLLNALVLREKAMSRARNGSLDDDINAMLAAQALIFATVYGSTFPNGLEADLLPTFIGAFTETIEDGPQLVVTAPSQGGHA